MSLRLVRYYYVILNYKQLRKLGKLASRDDGFFEENFCYRLEGRLCCLIHRTQLLINMFSSIYFIRTNNVLVNKKILNKPNTLINIGDIVCFVKDNFQFLRFNFFIRAERDGFFSSVPRYLFNSYKMRFFSLLAYPREVDLAFPMYFDIYRVSGYY